MILYSVKEDVNMALVLNNITKAENLSKFLRLFGGKHEDRVELDRNSPKLFSVIDNVDTGVFAILHQRLGCFQEALLRMQSASEDNSTLPSVTTSDVFLANTRKRFKEHQGQLPNEVSLSSSDSGNGSDAKHDHAIVENTLSMLNLDSVFQKHNSRFGKVKKVMQYDFNAST